MIETLEPKIASTDDVASPEVKKLRVSIVMPAYNEERVIGQVLDTLRATGDYHEIIVVDDFSSDRTSEVAREHGAIALRHPYNIGNGGAVKTGIRAATGDVIVLMDADGQHPPSDVPRLLAYIGDFDMVVGARTRASDAKAHRTAANTFFNRYASYVVGYPVKDLTSGFRVAKAGLLKKFVYLLPNRYSYPTTITIAMFRSGFRVRYEPIISPARKGGRSSIRPIRDGLRFTLTITRMAVLFVPLKIFLPLSLLFGLLGLGYGAYQLIFEQRFSNMPPLLITISIIVFLMGLIAEQIALLRLMFTAQE